MLFVMGETSLKYFKQVLGVITQFDIPEEDCLRAAALIKIPESARVNADYISDMLRYAAERLNDPLIAFKCGLKYPILQYTRPADLLKFCNHIEHAAELYQTYSPLFHTLGRSSNVISENGIDRMIWVPNFDLKDIDKYRPHVELIMTNYMTSIDWLAWKIPNAVYQLNMIHDASAPMKQYQKLLGREIKFGQKEYSIMLKDDVRYTTFETADSIQLAKIKLNLDKAINELYEQDNFVARVELQIRKLVDQEGSKKSVVAEAMDMSERSLSRALANNGSSYREIKNRVLRDLAYIKVNEGLPLVEIAHALGYNDQSAFTRAYKIWFGSTPGKAKQTKLH